MIWQEVSQKERSGSLETREPEPEPRQSEVEHEQPELKEYHDQIEPPPPEPEPPPPPVELKRRKGTSRSAQHREKKAKAAGREPGKPGRQRQRSLKVSAKANDPAALAKQLVEFDPVFAREVAEHILRLLGEN